MGELPSMFIEACSLSLASEDNAREYLSRKGFKEFEILGPTEDTSSAGQGFRASGATNEILSANEFDADKSAGAILQFDYTVEVKSNTLTTCVMVAIDFGQPEIPYFAANAFDSIPGARNQSRESTPYGPGAFWYVDGEETLGEIVRLTKDGGVYAAIAIVSSQ